MTATQSNPASKIPVKTNGSALFCEGGVCLPEVPAAFYTQSIPNELES